ncbi:MAG: LamG domain-containing protein, partial [Marinoscillum sp.]
MVENHLSSKYDIAHSNDLYAGDTSPNGEFDFDVIGIGQESDGSDPEGAAGGVILTNAGVLQDDGDYMFAGHDGTTHSIVQTDLPSGYTNRWARSWYVDVTDVTTTGTGGLATVTFDLAEAGLTLESANYALAYRAANSGAFSEFSTSSTIEGTKISFSADAATIADGYYTLVDDYVPNNALDFDGSDDYVGVASFTAPTGDFTFEAWVYYEGDGTGGFETILEFDNDAPWLGINGTLEFYQVGSDPSGFPENVWTHIALTFNSSSNLGNLYVNGEIVAADLDASGIVPFTGTQLFIGGDPNSSEMFPGAIDEVRIWDVERTQSEIISNAYTSLTTGTGLAASYDFNQSSGPLTDISTNGRDGTLFGGVGFIASTPFDSDVFAPVFESGYPSVSNVTDGDFDLTVRLNEAGTVYYVLLAAGSGVPTIGEIQTGTAAGQVASGNFAVAIAS